MRMGGFATIGAYGKNSLIHLLLDNEVHESTGAQATVSAGVSFARIADACGYGVALAGRTMDLVNELISDAPAQGPRFGHLKIRRGVEAELPRPRLSPPQVRERLMRHLGALEFT
jgi:phosphonopyruvate decarboxylase